MNTTAPPAISPERSSSREVPISGQVSQVTGDGVFSDLVNLLLPSSLYSTELSNNNNSCKSTPVTSKEVFQESESPELKAKRVARRVSSRRKECPGCGQVSLCPGQVCCERCVRAQKQLLALASNNTMERDKLTILTPGTSVSSSTEVTSQSPPAISSLRESSLSRSKKCPASSKTVLPSRSTWCKSSSNRSVQEFQDVGTPVRARRMSSRRKECAGCGCVSLLPGKSVCCNSCEAAQEKLLLQARKKHCKTRKVDKSKHRTVQVSSSTTITREVSPATQSSGAAPGRALKRRIRECPSCGEFLVLPCQAVCCDSCVSVSEASPPPPEPAVVYPSIVYVCPGLGKSARPCKVRMMDVEVLTTRLSRIK